MIRFIDVADPEKKLAEVIARYEEKTGETLMPGDEHYIFLAQQVQVWADLIEELNYTANRNLLRYMDGELLDEYGGQFDVPRLAAKHATVKLKFQLMAALSFDVTIPSGVRVTPDGQLNFIVLEDAVIEAGDTAVEVGAIAEEAGSKYNGFLPGQIQNIVDVNLVGNIDSVTNITTSVGGSDVESDAHYRERIPMMWESISTCGSKEGYEYWARGSSPVIVDVEAVSNADSEITLYVLMQNADTPSQEILDSVLSATSAKKRRPLTDHVQAQGATQKSYNITLSYYINSADATNEAKIKTAVDAAINDFIGAQKAQLGGNLNPDDLRKAILIAGGYRIDITEPAYTELQPQEVAVAGTVTVTYGGLL